MTRLPQLTSVITTATAFAALCAGAGVANAADGFTQNNLISNMPGLATTTDSSLVNPWGVSFANGSPVWISDQGTQTSPLFSVTGSTGVGNAPLFTVNIPPAGASGPTGQVANAMGMGFDVSTMSGGNGAPANFIFANLNGSISAWNGVPKTQAFTQTSVAGASFTGLAINQGDTRLFAANDAGSGGIDVFDSKFKPVDAGGFKTPTAISGAGLVPFNVTDLGGNVFVTYALSGHIPQTEAMAGQGAVAEFSENGTLEKTIVGPGGPLASPWGVAIAPSSFGKFGGDILVGNFSFAKGVADTIDAFNPVTDALVGSIDVNPGAGNTAGGLWSIVFGGSKSDGTPDTLFFTDGINGETGGLFGSLTAAPGSLSAVPEPSTWAMMLAGFGGLALLATRRRRASPAIG
jgi:uncharacterized protein (TIGR03118 family)